MLFDYFLYPPVLGLAGLAIAFGIYHILSRHDHGDGDVKKIGDQIHLGAMVFMQREYKMLAIFAAVLLLAIFFSPLGTNTAIAFLAGALSSATAGYLGMFAAGTVMISLFFGGWSAPHQVLAFLPSWLCLELSSSTAWLLFVYSNKPKICGFRQFRLLVVYSNKPKICGFRQFLVFI